MKNRLQTIAITCCLSLTSFLLAAEEGMWLPQLLRQLNEKDMKLQGLQLNANDIYHPDSISLKDAIVLFGGGCTGEIISSKGLLLTNHHCGFDQIQERSTLEKNYLRDGFWAASENDEIPCPGLTATFIVRIEDVTSSFQSVLSDTLTESKRNEIIRSKASEIEKGATTGTDYQARVRQFYNGNEFYLIVTETYNDIRLVGTPPSSIGKFGGDTDNWMWPRHTGDFSIFRIYADAKNKPAAYNVQNKPYVPRKFFPISLKGINENDFTMVYGFPGRTQEYVSSYAVETLINTTNPNRIKVRDERLRIIGEAMRSSAALDLQYASKQSSISNGWKKMKGETKGLREANALAIKSNYEKGFQQWADQYNSNSAYRKILPDLQKLYKSFQPYLHANDFYNEAAFTPEILVLAESIRNINESISKKDTSLSLKISELRNDLPSFYKDYDKSTDRLLLASLLILFDANIADSLKPVHFLDMRKRYKGDIIKMTDAVFSGSILHDSAAVYAMLNLSPSKMQQKIAKDEAFRLADALHDKYDKSVLPKITLFGQQSARLNRMYMAAQRQYEPERVFYPDANSTLRITYGKVKGYYPRDAVHYTFQTYLDGVIEKYIPGDEEFDLPARLLELYKNKDYGQYAVDGKLPVAFIASNHTTGGNSGSPVINARGELIGTNYDRVWEGTMSDVLYNPAICRNITLDIRYTLFIIDKYANANRLINEMQLIK